MNRPLASVTVRVTRCSPSTALTPVAAAGTFDAAMCPVFGFNGPPNTPTRPDTVWPGWAAPGAEALLQAALAIVAAVRAHMTEVRTLR